MKYKLLLVLILFYAFPSYGFYVKPAGEMVPCQAIIKALELKGVDVKSSGDSSCDDSLQEINSRGVDINSLLESVVFEKIQGRN